MSEGITGERRGAAIEEEEAQLETVGGPHHWLKLDRTKSGAQKSSEVEKKLKGHKDGAVFEAFIQFELHLIAHTFTLINDSENSHLFVSQLHGDSLCS